MFSHCSENKIGLLNTADKNLNDLAPAQCPCVACLLLLPLLTARLHYPAILSSQECAKKLFPTVGAFALSVPFVSKTLSFSINSVFFWVPVQTPPPEKLFSAMSTYPPHPPHTCPLITLTPFYMYVLIVCALICPIH